MTSMLHRVRGIGLRTAPLLAALLLTGLMPATADDSTMKLSGYMQPEMLFNNQANPQFTPQVRRMRISLDGHSRDRFDFRAQYSFDRFNPELKDLYVTGYTPAVGLRVGQGKVPFSEEVLLSSSKRETLERPPVTRALWPGERDRGFAFTSRPHEKHGGQLTAGMIMGEGINNMNANPGYDVVLRYKQFFDGGKGSGFIGFQTGTDTPAAGVNTPMSIVGIGGNWADSDKDWKVYAEAHGGRFNSGGAASNVYGMFARGVRVFDKGEHSVYAQFDYWDPTVGGAADTQMGPVAGYIWQASPDTKLTLELNGRQNQATVSTDFQAGIRYQIDLD